jgi:hypothetical protein
MQAELLGDRRAIDEGVGAPHRFLGVLHGVEHYCRSQRLGLGYLCLIGDVGEYGGGVGTPIGPDHRSAQPDQQHVASP